MSSGLRSTTTNWSGAFVASEQCSGEGLVVECVLWAAVYLNVVKAKEVRAHSVFVRQSGSDQADNLPGRYNALLVEVTRAYPRIYNEAGYEIEYQANIPAKKSYIAPAVVDSAKLAELVGRGSGKAVPKGYLPSCGHLYPSTPFFEFWVDINKPKAKDIIVVDSVAILNAKATDAVTGGWSSTILQHADDDEPLPGEDQEGCDSDEWD